MWFYCAAPIYHQLHYITLLAQDTKAHKQEHRARFPTGDPHRPSVIKSLDGAHDCHSKCYIKGIKLLSTSDSKLHLTGFEWVHFKLRVKLQTAFRRFTPTTTTFSDDVISLIYPIWLFAQRCWVIAGSHRVAAQRDFLILCVLWRHTDVCDTVQQHLV